MWFGTWANRGSAERAYEFVRNGSNFNWSFITLLIIVLYIYFKELSEKHYRAVAAGLSLYMVHWLYEIANAIIQAVTGYALWTVSFESSSFVMLAGVNWEISMMFAVAGLAASKMLPADPKAKVLGINNRILFAAANAALASALEIFFASTPAFIWVYPWWGALPVFVTTYIPFFLAAFLVPDRSPRFQKAFIGGLFALNGILLALLIPLGVI
jgi:hypothetical protein